MTITDVLERFDNGGGFCGFRIVGSDLNVLKRNNEDRPIEITRRGETEVVLSRDEFIDAYSNETYRDLMTHELDDA